MAIGSSIAGQLGFTAETTPGTRIAPTKWAEILSESLTMGRKTLRSQAIGGGGAFRRQYTLLGQEPGGQIAMEASAENIGNMLKLALGPPVTTGPVSTVYTHTFNWLLTNPLPTATVQVGRPDVGGTVRPFDFIGMMVSTWELGITPNEYVKMTYDMAGRRVDTAQTLATPTWPTLTSFSSISAVMSILGATQSFDSLSIKGDNKLDISDVVSGTNPGERRVRQAGGPSITGSFGSDFQDMTAFTAFQNGTVGALTLTLTASASAVLTMTGRVQYVEDNSPSISGPDTVLKQAIPFAFVRDGANTDAQTFQIALQTTIATV